MMGTRSPQDKLFAADQIYLDYVGRDSLYGYLAQNRQQLFRDEDFSSLYCLNNGRTSVPPSLAISLLLLRAVEGVSLAEAMERSKYDLRWKVALGLEMEEVPMQKSALQEFEAKLVLLEMGEGLLQKSIAEARRAGYLNRTFGGWPSTSCFGRGLILGSNAGKRLYEAVTLAGEGFTVLANMDAVRGFPAAEAAGFPGNVEQAIGSVLGLKVLVAL